VTRCGKEQPGSGVRKRVQTFEDRLGTGHNIVQSHILCFGLPLETKYSAEIEDKLYHFNLMASHCFSSTNISDRIKSMDSFHLHKLICTAHES